MADPNAERDPLELLAAEYMERLRRGERLSIEDYAARHPALANEIRELFPTIAVTERLKSRQQQTSNGRVTLGPARLERLGDFRLIREIGRGGMGVVFEAEQDTLGRRVAIKVLPRQVLPDEKRLKRFQSEARIAANLHHTNIVEVFGVGEQDGFHYYVMQYIDGVGLDAVIPELVKAVSRPAGMNPPTGESAEKGMPAPALAPDIVRLLLGPEDLQARRLGPVYWRNVARIGLQAATALSHAHSQGVLHRDIKPANLLLGAHGSVWLTDFGLAKAALSGDVSLSKDVVGTLRYMPPEQLQGKTDQRSDIYSLGLTLYELLALRPAYAESDQSRLVQRIVQGPPDRPCHPDFGIPHDLETIVLKAVSHGPLERYQSAEGMADDLRRFLEDRPIHARRVSSLERLSRWCRRNKRLAALTGTTLFLVLLVAVIASVGYVRTRNALRGEALERSKAEANANLAMEALDRLFERFSPNRILVAPQHPTEPLSGELLELPGSAILSKEGAALLEEMMPFYDRLAQQTGSNEKLRTAIAEANRRVGAIRQRLGQLDESAGAYRRALQLYGELQAREPASPDFKVAMAQINNDLGRIFAARRQMAEARQAHLDALKLLEGDAQPASAPETVRFELARTCYFLGTQERPLPAADPRQGPRPTSISPEQRGRLTQAVALLKELSTSPTANPEYRHLLALCYLEGAAADETPGLQGGASLAIELLERLVQEFPGTPDYAYDLSEAYMRIHIPRPPISPSTQTAIEERFGKALTLLENLVARYPDIPDFLASEARLHQKRGALHRQMEHWAEAEQSFRKAIAIQARVVNQLPESPTHNLWMSSFRIGLGDVLIRRNQPAEARAELEASLSALVRLAEQKPELRRPCDLLALGYSKLAIALRQTGEKELAEEAGRKAEQERNAALRAP